MANYVINPNADQDLDRWDAKLRNAFELLGQNPKAGHTRKDLTDEEVLFWPVAKYLIIYRPHHQGAEILDVTQGARDIPSFLRRYS